MKSKDRDKILQGLVNHEGKWISIDEKLTQVYAGKTPVQSVLGAIPKVEANVDKVETAKLPDPPVSPLLPSPPPVPVKAEAEVKKPDLPKVSIPVVPTPPAAPVVPNPAPAAPSLKPVPVKPAIEVKIQESPKVKPLAPNTGDSDNLIEEYMVEHRRHMRWVWIVVIIGSLSALTTLIVIFVL